MYCLWILVFAQEEQTINSQEIALIGYVVFALFLLSAMIITFFGAFQKRKNKLLMEKIEQQKKFDEELSRTQTEIQEQTLKHIGWELHDNVGQLLAYANMQLNTVLPKIPEEMRAKAQDATDSVKRSLSEVRSLSKSLNNEVLLNMGLEDSIRNELNRLKRMSFGDAELTVKGHTRALNDSKHGIIIFRILQEFFSNAMKYSQADNIDVILDYQTEQLIITAKDNGVGFNTDDVEKGSGLINMKSRAELINATFELHSQVGEGVVIRITYPFVEGALS